MNETRSHHARAFAVDVVRNPENVTLTADLPGVAEGDLDIRVERDVLHIEAPAHASESEPGRARHREFGPVRYRRRFRLDKSVDRAGIRADLQHGVLTLTVPLREEERARKIPVRTGA